MNDNGTRRYPDENETHYVDLKNAAVCPVCYDSPRLTQEAPVFNHPHRTFDYVLRCPMDHPYVATGQTISQAVKLWNAYVESRTNEVNHLRSALANPDTHGILSPCRHCLAHTRSKLTTLGLKIIEQCETCKLMKSIKEVD